VAKKGLIGKLAKGLVGLTRTKGKLDLRKLTTIGLVIGTGVVKTAATSRKGNTTSVSSPTTVVAKHFDPHDPDDKHLDGVWLSVSDALDVGATTSPYSAATKPTAEFTLLPILPTNGLKVR
jgi:hypothetical protein